MKLVSMVDYVLEQFYLLYNAKITQNQYVTRTKKYAYFFKRPLELWMFVACDEDGNVLDKYKYFPCSMKFANEINEYHIKYQKAKEKCLFEGDITCLKQKDYYIIYLNESTIYLSWNKSKAIQDIVYSDIELTSTVIKQLQS